MKPDTKLGVKTDAGMRGDMYKGVKETQKPTGASMGKNVHGQSGAWMSAAGKPRPKV